jgi:glycine/serine hydroxymethyltransferase
VRLQGLELIPSENFLLRSVMEAVGSIMTNTTSSYSHVPACMPPRDAQRNSIARALQGLELIPSENLVSSSVMEAVGSIMTTAALSNIYA